MMRRLTTLFCAALCGIALPAQVPGQPSAATDAEVSCRACHPGASRGLRQSPHATLLDRPTLHGQVCASCHGDQSAHAAARGRGIATAPAVPAVTQAACAACHAESGYTPAQGQHPLVVTGSGAAPRPAPDAARLLGLAEREADASIDWSAFAELGYRFVHRTGSRDAFRTDLDLESTLLLRDFEVRGDGRGAAAIDTVSLRGRDLGDPRWDSEFALRTADGLTIRSSYDRSRYRYAATGNYHRVDRNSRDWTTTFDWQAEHWQLFGSYATRDQDGFWLTQRLGDQNLPVQTVVDNVANPRRLRMHEAELGIRAEFGPFDVTAAAGFVEERSVDRWSWSRPATNPAFTESEDLTSASSLDGPTGRIGLLHDGGPVRFEITGLLRDLDRDVDATGTEAGFVTSTYTGTTTATGRGHSRLQQWQLDADVDLNASLQLRAEARYRDYRERLRLQQTDIQTFTSPSTVVQTTTSLDDETVQRLFDGDLSLAFSPTDDFEIALGYGLAREQLRVSAPGPADPLDFRRGHLDDDGVLANLRWRFAADWTLRAEGRDFATDGVRLHELTPQRARLAAATIDWQHDGSHAAVFARHRHNANDVSSHRLDAFTTGIHGTTTAGPAQLSGGYTFADTESRTRTNFYFDPDPTPQATLVGFAGETHTWNLDLVLTPPGPFTFELGGAVTRTIGTFAVDTADLRAACLFHSSENGSGGGAEWRHVRYDDQNGRDDWAADLVVLFWRIAW